MKRDMDLIRELLLKLEALPMRRGGIVTITPDADEVAVEGYSVDQIDYHLSQIRRSGLIDEGGAQPMSGIGFRLDALRQPVMISSTPSGTRRPGLEQKRPQPEPAALPSTYSRILRRALSGNRLRIERG
jgi:hypothetical protein